jgi:hypothetical protein
MRGASLREYKSRLPESGNTHTWEDSNGHVALERRESKKANSKYRAGRAEQCSEGRSDSG